jgi:extradiol dioxygenase family protein
MKGTFHIAFATRDLEKSKDFYENTLECTRGRSGTTWIDYDFFGHQLTIQFISSKQEHSRNYYHPKTMFPSNHFGIILKWNAWQNHRLYLKEKLENKTR